MSYNSSETKSRFIEIIRENQGLIYKFAKMYSNSFEDEQDLYQDIVYQLWNSYPFFQNESKITSWMYRIALNTGIHYLNKDKQKAHQVAMNDTLLNKPEINDESEQERHDILFARIKKLNNIKKASSFFTWKGNVMTVFNDVRDRIPDHADTNAGDIYHGSF